MEQNLKSIEENVLESCLHSSVSLSRKPPQFAPIASFSASFHTHTHTHTLTIKNSVLKKCMAYHVCYFQLAFFTY